MIGSNQDERDPDERLNLAGSVPFFIVNLLGIAGFYYVAADWRVLCAMLALYYVRMFFVTAFRHRYFSHKSFRVRGGEGAMRGVQYAMALLATTDTQKGPLWWAAWHRHHHAESDKPEDVHTILKGFWWSHVGWILCDKYKRADYRKVRDLSRCRELMALERPFGTRRIPVGYFTMPALLGLACLSLGGLPLLLGGFFTSTFLLYHGTFCINSLAHMWGSQRFDTGDQSRNCGWLNIFTLGEGWHNNHHHQQAYAAQAITRKEKLSDVTFWILCLWSYTGMIRLNLRKAR